MEDTRSEDCGVDLDRLREVEVPSGDDAKAEAFLHELACIALGPYELKVKLDAIKSGLTFTKQKPASKVEAKVESTEDWLKSTLAEIDDQ